MPPTPFGNNTLSHIRLIRFPSVHDGPGCVQDGPRDLPTGGPRRRFGTDASAHGPERPQEASGYPVRHPSWSQRPPRDSKTTHDATKTARKGFQNAPPPPKTAPKASRTAPQAPGVFRSRAGAVLARPGVLLGRFGPLWKLFRASLRPSCVGPGLSRGSLALF